MLRNIIQGNYTTEIYKLGATALRRGTVVAKTLATATADKATSKGTEVYILDFDFQPTGAFSDTDISAYSDEADIVKANASAILVKYNVGCQFATDQVDTTVALVAGDYLIAGTGATAGKFIKAVVGNITPYKFNNIYLDGSKTLHQIEVVEIKTV